MVCGTAQHDRTAKLSVEKDKTNHSSENLMQNEAACPIKRSTRIPKNF
jgi:hypothetical protein